MLRTESHSAAPVGSESWGSQMRIAGLWMEKMGWRGSARLKRGGMLSSKPSRLGRRLGGNGCGGSVGEWSLRGEREARKIGEERALGGRGGRGRGRRGRVSEREQGGRGKVVVVKRCEVEV